MKRDAYARVDETQAADGDLDAFPEFELTYLYSERPMLGRPPRKVTLLPEDNIEDNYTEWISADFSAAVDLREVA